MVSRDKSSAKVPISRFQSAPSIFFSSPTLLAYATTKGGGYGIPTKIVLFDDAALGMVGGSAVLGSLSGTGSLLLGNVAPGPTVRMTANAIDQKAVTIQDTGLLVTQHQDLRRVILNLPKALRTEPKKWRAALHMIRGAAAHDLYHAGQILLLRRLSPADL